MSEFLSIDGDREKTLSSEENDLLQRSNKKYKRNTEEINQDVTTDTIVLGGENSNGGNIANRKSYSQMTQAFGKATNPLFVGGNGAEEGGSDEESDNDVENEDVSCPNIILTSEDKRRIRSPWKDAIIIKLFDKKMGYEVLMRRLKFKWQLKGSIALTDVGHAFYIVRFTSIEDYEFVMTQGPWMIGDSYLTIRKWIPNFIADEAPMRHLTAWVRIPNLSVEYFDKLILHKIGSKIGKVIKIDRNTESMDRGQYVRFCIEVDLAKPLLSKFKLNGRIWKIQYEGLKMICFKCGHLGHKEDKCEAFHSGSVGLQSNSILREEIGGDVARSNSTKQGPEVNNKYGEWMLVSRPNRRQNVKSNTNNSSIGDMLKAPTRSSNLEKAELGSRVTNPQVKLQEQESSGKGSRFEILEVIDMDTNEGVYLEMVHNSSPMVEASDVVQDSSKSESGKPDVNIELIKENFPDEERGQVMETISQIVEREIPVKSGGKDICEFSLAKISLFPKDKKSESEGSRQVGRKPKDVPQKSQTVRAPKFKKGLTRKPPFYRSLGKENIPINSASYKQVHKGELRYLNDGVQRPNKDTNHVGIQDSTSGGILCGASDGGSVNGDNPPVGQQSSYGDQFVPSSGERDALLDDDIGTTVHNGRSNEGFERDVSDIIESHSSDGI